MLQYSDVTKRSFHTEDAVFYRNMVQSAWMLSHSDCVLLDVFEDRGKLVMVFPREQHNKWIKDWAERNKDRDCAVT